MNKKTVKDVDFRSKRVFMRVDFNVPISESGAISDDTRINEAIPTIKKVLSDGGRLILASHLGRPKGKRDLSYTMARVADVLSEKLEKAVLFVNDCIGKDVERAVGLLKDGDVMLLENLRFYKEEEANDENFAKSLAGLADVYVNDAFGAAHRAHASTEGIARFMKTAVAGYLMEKELRYLGAAITNPKRPYVSIIGGAKISGKIDVIEHLMDKVDTILVGGAMIFTFFKAKGMSVGASLVEDDKLELAMTILEKAKRKKVDMLLPVDVVIADAFDKDASFRSVSVEDIPNKDWMGLDIGEKTIALYQERIRDAKTVVWNGPMGVFEMKNFAKGTFAIAKVLAEATKKGAVTIVGGGDSASAIAKAGLSGAVSHVSTGGGACIEYLEGKKLPGVEALNPI